MQLDLTRLERICELLLDDVELTDGCSVEDAVMARLMQVGVHAMEQVGLAAEPKDGVVKDGGRQWVRVLMAERTYLSRFGPFVVKRGLYRAVHNGPTRCFMEERLGIVDGFWTPRAARTAVLLSTDLTSRAAEAFFAENGGMAPSKSSLERLPIRMSGTWEADRERLEAELRGRVAIPIEATTVAVMLDGVMVRLNKSNRAERTQAARDAGRKVGGPIGSKEASVGALVFYDARGERLMTRRFGRMPEDEKATLKATLAAELEEVRKLRPDLIMVAVSDGAPNHWSFLESLDPDHMIIDYFHVVEHVKGRLDKALGVGTLPNQRMLEQMQRLLLETPDGHEIVFAALEAVEKRKKTWKPRKTTGRGTQPTFYERHRDRMQYVLHRALGLPIGSGVIEGTCRYLVVDRLRRTGMRWSERGGQAILTFRSQVVNGQFNEAWELLMDIEAPNRWRPRATPPPGGGGDNQLDALAA